MTHSPVRKESFNIALVSDFFCPNAGGVETHIYFLAQCLLELGHRVIVITHAYGDRRGIRYLSNGLKVYYLPFLVIYNGCSLATIIGSLPWLRKIFLREKIQLIHGHSTFSSMAHEAMFNGWLMGIKTVFTDHSLFGFADASAILTNTLVLQYSLANVDRVICVSYTSKENTVLRGKLDPRKVFTIPNAIETRLFYPDPKQFYENPTTIIFLGRLVYRKGADLLCAVIPKVCARHPQVRFIVGGDGPKRLELEEMREQYHLHSRVTLLGTLPHDMVREVLVQGQIFINTSLTEAFCMSIVEAASCGLHVVSTKVGGIPEVLPAEFISLEEPVPELLVDALSVAIKKREAKQLMDPVQKHKAVSNMYYWPEVARRTELVYKDAMREPTPQWRRGLKKYADQGIGFGILYIIVSLINMLFLKVLEFFDPSKKGLSVFLEL
nr:PIGA and Glycosyl transferase domain containing protein [Haemonchus contortus]